MCVLFYGLVKILSFEDDHRKLALQMLADTAQYGAAVLEKIGAKVDFDTLIGAIEGYQQDFNFSLLKTEQF
jgi:hypothetical protein